MTICQLSYNEQSRHRCFSKSYMLRFSLVDVVQTLSVQRRLSISSSSSSYSKREIAMLVPIVTS